MPDAVLSRSRTIIVRPGTLGAQMFTAISGLIDRDRERSRLAATNGAKKTTSGVVGVAEFDPPRSHRRPEQMPGQAIGSQRAAVSQAAPRGQVEESCGKPESAKSWLARMCI